MTISVQWLDIDGRAQSCGRPRLEIVVVAIDDTSDLKCLQSLVQSLVLAVRRCIRWSSGHRDHLNRNGHLTMVVVACNHFYNDDIFEIFR